jgi:hypothetical protein
MSAWIEAVCPDDLSKVLRAANVSLTAREARIIDTCQRTSFETWVAYNDGQLVAAWGIIPPTVLSDEVYLWLHTTQAVNTSQFLFVRHSQIVIQKLLAEYRAITGHTKVSAKHSQRWLKWLGAEFGSPTKGTLPFRIER